MNYDNELTGQLASSFLSAPARQDRVPLLQFYISEHLTRLSASQTKQIISTLWRLSLDENYKNAFSFIGLKKTILSAFFSFCLCWIFKWDVLRTYFADFFFPFKGLCGFMHQLFVLCWRWWVSNDRKDKRAGVSLSYILWSWLGCIGLVKEANLIPQDTDTGLSPP